MRQNRKNRIILIAISIFVIVLSLFFFKLSKSETNKEPTNIIPDTINAVTLSSSTTFFEYKGTYMGYQYELFDSFCRHLNKPYKIKVLKSYQDLLHYIEVGHADICITPIQKDKKLRNKFSFVDVKNTSSINLVSQKNNSVSNIKDLIGDTVVVPANTIYEKRMEQLNNQLGGGINIKLVNQDSLSVEDLIRLVSRGAVKYTIADEYLCKLSNTYYNNISVDQEVGFKRDQYWIVSKKMTLLTDAVNKWAESNNYRSSVIGNIYKRYFEISKGFASSPRESVDEISSFKLKGKLTPFDDIFKKEAKRLGVDWTLLAAIAWQESRFNSSIVGWSGARGLMGIMPSTGNIYKASKSDLLDPQISVRVSVSCLIDTKKYLGIKSYDKNNLAIILAGYNAGIGHIMDAKKLAEKFNYNPNLWYNNLEECVRLKSKAKYYNNQVCKFGYLRSEETIDYVNNVLDRYAYYRRIVR